MKRFAAGLIIAAVMASIVGAAPPGAPPPRYSLPNFPRVGQEMSNWCWAACGQMVIQHRRNLTIHQCQQVSKTYRMNCCDAGIGANQANQQACNLRGFPKFLPYGVDYKWTDNQGLRWSQIVGRLFSDGTPIIYSSRAYKTSHSSHMVVIIGYSEVVDPASGVPLRTLTAINPYSNQKPFRGRMFPRAVEESLDYVIEYDQTNIYKKRLREYYDFLP